MLKNWIWIILLLCSLTSCRDTFEQSVYSAEVPEENKASRSKNFERLNNIMPDPADTSSFKIALISDTHTSYNDLQDAIDHINTNPDIKFILHGGDMTDGGMLAEFILFQSIVDQANVPYFTVIGNHDCLANGFGIYKDMFGTDDYSFVAGNCKFIFFNDIIWELEFREPDYFWLMDELMDQSDYSHFFIIAHIAPFSDSFTPLQQQAYTTLADSNNVSVSIHGHHHQHSYQEYYEDGVWYMTVGAIAKRYYVTLYIRPDTVIMERVGF